MASLLRPGGRLILNLPAFPWVRSTHDIAVHIAHRFTVPELNLMLKEAGLEPLLCTYRNMFLFLPAVMVRMAKRWFCSHDPEEFARYSAPGSWSP